MGYIGVITPLWDIQAGGHLNKHTQQKPTAQALGGF